MTRVGAIYLMLASLTFLSEGQRLMVLHCPDRLSACVFVCLSGSMHTLNLMQNKLRSVPSKAIRSLTTLQALDLSINNITDIKTADFAGN